MLSEVQGTLPTMRNRNLGQPAGLNDWPAIKSNATFSGDDYALYESDIFEAMSQIPDSCVNTVLTSPPYWSVRDYGHADQIGLEDEAEDYVEKIVKVFREVYRTLADDGTAWLNIGDSYFSRSITVNGKPPRTGWRRSKQLSLIPFRVAIALQEDGWWIRNAAIWRKTNAMPSSVKDRLTNTWEPIFLLTKSEHYYFNLDRIRVPHQTDDSIERRRAESGNATGKAQGKDELRKWLNSPRHRATIDGIKSVQRRPNAPDPVELAGYLKMALKESGKSIKWVAEQLELPFERTRHYFRTDRIGSRLPPPEVWQKLQILLELDDEYDEAMETEIGDNVFRNHPMGKNPGDVLDVAIAASNADHFAVMPQKLADFALQATLPPNGSCLDPFMGSGTTGLITRKLGGRFIGVDLKAEYMSEYLSISNSSGQERERQHDLLF